MNAPVHIPGRTPVIRISLPYLVSLANALEPLAQITASDRQRIDVASVVWRAQSMLSAFANESVYTAVLRSSRVLADQLAAELAAFDVSDMNKPVDWSETFSIAHAYREYKTALQAELGIMPTYLVGPKGGFDTLSLLDAPLSLYPVELGTKVPEAMYDVAEVGKALAFELATACGFYVFRVTESVLRRYYAEVTGGAAAPKVRSIGVYVHAMRRQKCGDEKILAVLKQLADLHRNPLIHPEVNLTMDEAIAILGISRSAVSAMLERLPFTEA